MNTSIIICYYCNKLATHEEKLQYGLHEKCFRAWFQLAETSDFRNLRTRSTTSNPESIAFTAINSRFFAGKFKKYSGELNKQSYILKVGMQECPELPATEFLCNQIAKALTIEVPDFYLLPNFHGTVTFVTKDFVQAKRPANLVHIYQYRRKDDPHDCETLLRIVKEQTGRLSEVERFIELCLFDSLIGNGDRHGSNIAILELSDKKVLAPFYDNPSNLGLEEEKMLGAHLTPRGYIYTSTTNEPSMKDYVAEFKGLSYEKTVKTFASRVNVQEIIDLINRSFISEKRKNAIKRLVTERYQELKDAI